jgi:hypothetical protein
MRIRLGLPNARFEFPFLPGMGNCLETHGVLPITKYPDAMVCHSKYTTGVRTLS